MTLSPNQAELIENGEQLLAALCSDESSNHVLESVQVLEPGYEGIRAGVRGH